MEGGHTYLKLPKFTRLVRKYSLLTATYRKGLRSTKIANAHHCTHSVLVSTLSRKLAKKLNLRRAYPFSTVSSGAGSLVSRCGGMTDAWVFRWRLEVASLGFPSRSKCTKSARLQLLFEILQHRPGTRFSARAGPSRRHGTRTRCARRVRLL